LIHGPLILTMAGYLTSQQFSYFNNYM